MAAKRSEGQFLGFAMGVDDRGQTSCVDYFPALAFDNRWPRVSPASHGQRWRQFRCQPVHGRSRSGSAECAPSQPGSGMDSDYVARHRADDWASSAQPGDSKQSWINLAWQNDPRAGTARAWVNLDPSDADMKAWQEMEDAAVALAKAVAENSADIRNVKKTRSARPTMKLGPCGWVCPASLSRIHSASFITLPTLPSLDQRCSPSSARQIRHLLRRHSLGERRRRLSVAERPLPTSRSSHFLPDHARDGRWPAAVTFSPSSDRSWKRDRTAWACCGTHVRSFATLC
jgi:hypothetical protein